LVTGKKEKHAMMKVKRFSTVDITDNRDIETRLNEFFKKENIRKKDIATISSLHHLNNIDVAGRTEADFYIFYDDNAEERAKHAAGIAELVNGFRKP
jgi:cobalamin biosynthesis protein CbiG